MVGKELEEIVVNRDYFNNLIKKWNGNEKIKVKLRKILNFYHPRFMRQKLNIKLRNFIKDHNYELDTTYLE